MPAVRKVGAGKKPRAKTPDISVVNEYYQDEAALILNEAKAALGTKANGMSFRYGSSNSRAVEMDSLNGWVPVVTGDGENRKAWRHKADPLLMRPKAQSDKEQKQAADVARSQLQNAIAASGEDNLTPE